MSIAPLLIIREIFEDSLSDASNPVKSNERSGRFVESFPKILSHQDNVKLSERFKPEASRWIVVKGREHETVAEYTTTILHDKDGLLLLTIVNCSKSC